MPAVLVDVADHVMTVTLNRPEKKNAVNCAVMCHLYDAWNRVDEDDGRIELFEAMEKVRLAAEDGDLGEGLDRPRTLRFAVDREKHGTDDVVAQRTEPAASGAVTFDQPVADRLHEARGAQLRIER